MGSVAKKRGRPVGSKNKPKIVKTIRITNTEATLAKKMGVSVEQYAKSKIALEKKPRRTVKKKINWERLARQLQTALHDEIMETNALIKRIEDLQFNVANLEHQAIGYRAVVSYLENQIANDSV